MNVKSIVIGLTTLAVVASTWWAQESVRRRPQGDVVELYTPRLRPHDVRADPNIAPAGAGPVLTRAIFRDESDLGTSTDAHAQQAAAEQVCADPVSSPPHSIAPADSTIALAPQPEPTTREIEVADSSESEPVATSKEPSTGTPAADAAAAVALAAVTESSPAPPADPSRRDEPTEGLELVNSAPSVATSVTETTAGGLELSSPQDERSAAAFPPRGGIRAGTQLVLKSADPAPSKSAAPLPTAPASAPLASTAQASTAQASTAQASTTQASTTQASTAQVWGSAPAADANETLWPRSSEAQAAASSPPLALLARQATSTPPAIPPSAPPAKDDVPLVPSLQPSPASATRPAAATLPEANGPATPIATRTNSAAAEWIESPAANASSLSSAVLHRAESHLEYGRSLATRGSLYSARAEFQMGLKLVVESLDAPTGGQTHARQFDAALRALKEAEDFVPSAGDESILMPLVEITRAHQSHILEPEQCQGLTPLKAMQAYYSYASAQLATACGDVPVASELLYALGKLHAVLAREEVAQPSTHRAISLVMYQAALAVDPRNFKSANELGVAYAKLGYPQAAKTALMHSLSIEPTAHGWANLAYVHRQLGEENLALKAEREREKLDASQGEVGGDDTASSIRWVSPDEFAYPTTPGEFEAQPPATPATAPPTPLPPSRRAAPEKQPMWDQLKNAFRSQ